jgi:hypothetical protein
MTTSGSRLAPLKRAGTMRRPGPFPFAGQGFCCEAIKASDQLITEISLFII